ncbi:MAG: MBL fold metallo-hydrolase [Clostridiales bacterium]|nr:MBL fold metallo-hydrolase [Clostridiales bacterium]
MYEITQIHAGANCYLVTQDNVSILVDTGVKGFEEKILKQCEGKEVKLIVLTHGHIDHMQNAAYIAQSLQVPIAMHEKDIPLLKDNLCREMKAQGILGNMVRFFSVLSAKSAQPEKFKPDILLKEGDNLRDFGIDAEVVELPGHTAGSIGLKVGEDTLLVGDALMHMMKAGPTLLYEEYEQMLESVRKIQNMGDRKIYFGHGEMVQNRKWV